MFFIFKIYYLKSFSLIKKIIITCITSMIINGNKIENNNNLKYNNKEYLSKLQSGVIK